MFSKARATSLPPHRPYDCGIDPPTWLCSICVHLYSLAASEREEMDFYRIEITRTWNISSPPDIFTLGRLFLTQFNLTLRPGSRNDKPDALSRHFSEEKGDSAGTPSRIPFGRHTHLGPEV